MLHNDWGRPKTEHILIYFRVCIATLQQPNIRNLKIENGTVVCVGEVSHKQMALSQGD